MHKQPYRRSLSVKGFSLHQQTISRAAHRLGGAWPLIKSDAEVDPKPRSVVPRAENMFERDGEATAFWLAETADWGTSPTRRSITRSESRSSPAGPANDGLWFFQTRHDE
jgi:hypothetical protein